MPVTSKQWIERMEEEVNSLTSRPIEMQKPGGDDDLVNNDATQNIQLHLKSDEDGKEPEVVPPRTDVNIETRKSQDKPLPRADSKDFIEQLKEV